VSLPILFERHFSGTVKYRRDNDRTPEGEVITFIEAVMHELGRPYSRGAIGKAITAFKDYRAGYRDELEDRDRQLGKIKQK
jgi:hypothetical protein